MTNKLICVEYRDGSILLCDEWEYQDVLEMAGYMQIDIKSHYVEEKMYRITWYDDIDEEWCDEWFDNECDCNNFKKKVEDAEVEYRVREYN